MELNENSSVSELSNLSEKEVSKEVNLCMRGLAKIKQKVDSAIKNALNAKISSDNAKKVTLAWYKIGDKAKAIEALQKAMVDVSTAQNDQADAIQLLLEYQRNVANGMKFLFVLGAQNMAANRTVVREVEMRLKNASEEEIGEMARNELRGVLAQLKAQLDFQERQEKLIKDHKKVKAIAQEANEELVRQAEKDIEHDKAIYENRRQIGSNRKDIAEHGKAIHDNREQIGCNRKDINANAQLIALIKETLSKHRHEIAGVKVFNKSTKAFWITSVTALMFSIISFIVINGL